MEIHDWEENCLLLLSEMHSGNEQKWSKGKAQLYLLVLRSLGEQASRAAVERAVLTEEWRPSPAALRDIAANLASPLPTENVIWVELWHRMIHVAYGPPPWSHPMLEDIAEGLGGFSFLYQNYWPDTDAFRLEALQRRCQEVYRECAAKWRETVADQLGLPPVLREPRYFPQWQTFVAPKSLPYTSEEPRPITPQEFQNAIPSEKMRERFRQLRGLPHPPSGKATVEHVGLSPEKREEIEAELQARKRVRTEP